MVALFCPDLEAIRRGAILIVECEGYDWKKNCDVNSLKRVWTEIAAVYPCRWEKVKYFNAGMSMNVVASMVRPFLPKELQRKLEFGCQFEQRLDELYLVPSLQAAHERLLGRVEESLRRRYINEKLFTL